MDVQSIQNLKRCHATSKQLKTCLPPCLLSRIYLQQSEGFCSTFSHYNTKSDTDTIFFNRRSILLNAKTANRTTHIHNEQNTTHHPHSIQHYDRQDTTQQTLLYTHLLPQFCASSSSAISRSVQKLFHDIMYTNTNNPNVPTYKLLYRYSDIRRYNSELLH